MNKHLRELLRLKQQINESEQLFDDFDVYSQEGICTLHDDDEINSAEEGFMVGYMGA